MPAPLLQLHDIDALLHLRDPQWVDRPVLSTYDPTLATAVIDFSIATAAPPPLPRPTSNHIMDGAVVYDAYPVAASTVTSTLAAAAAAAISTSAAVMSSSASSLSAGADNPADDDDRAECRLLGSFALFVQLALGGLALMSLVYKRWRERPQRPVKIWFFDASKQVFGSVLVHMANVFMSMLTSGRFSVKVEPATVSAAAVAVVRRFAAGGGGEGDGGGYTPNPCSFYLLNLAIDVSCKFPNSGNQRGLFWILEDDERSLLLTATPRPRSVYPFSSSSSASSPNSSPTRPSATRPSPSNPATTAAHHAHGGGSSSRSSTSAGSLA